MTEFRPLRPPIRAREPSSVPQYARGPSPIGPRAGPIRPRARPIRPPSLPGPHLLELGGPP